MTKRLKTSTPNSLLIINLRGNDPPPLCMLYKNASHLWTSFLVLVVLTAVPFNLTITYIIPELENYHKCTACMYKCIVLLYWTVYIVYWKLEKICQFIFLKHVQEKNIC